MAALLIFVLAMTGCGAGQGNNKGGTKDAAVNETVDNDADVPADAAAAEEGTGQAPEGESAPAQEDESAGQVQKESSESVEGAGQTPDEQPVDEGAALAEDGTYTSKDDVAQYIYIYGHLPSNFITKKEANELGWQGGSLEPYAPGKCIGGSHFGNYEGLLPEKEGRTYTECDIDTLGADKRGAKRIVFSNDGLIYYTGDHYESFELLYGED